MAKRSKSNISAGTIARQAKSKELAKKYKHEASLLKEKGILSGRVNARKNITRATRTKINKFRDVLEGKAIAVRTPKNVRAKYRDSGTLKPGLVSERGSFLVVPKYYEGQRAKLRKGELIEVTRPLKNGEEAYVIFPIPAEQLPDLVERLITDPTLDGLKMADEMFSFRINGHNANYPATDAAELGRELMKYTSLMQQAAKGGEMPALTFQRFKLGKGASDLRNTHNPETRIYDFAKPGRYGRPDASGRNTGGRDWHSERKAKTAAERKAKQRAAESEEERAARLARAKTYQSNYRRFGPKKAR
jgi:hypothetical protein